MTTLTATQHATSRSIWKLGLGAAAISVAANIVVFLTGYATGIFASLTLDPSAGAQMSIEPVILVSAVAGFFGVLAFGLLRKHGTAGFKLFCQLAIVLLIISFFAPLAIPDTSAAETVVLNLMHVVSAAAVLWMAWLLVDK
jgi:hypothetical protein